jgi:hypothetical protein
MSVQVVPPFVEVQTSPLSPLTSASTAISFVPVASEPTESHTCDGGEDVHVTPPVADVQMFPPSTTATRLLPVASDATDDQTLPAPGGVRSVQVKPPSTEVQMPVRPATTSFWPVEFDATDTQLCPPLSAVWLVQVTPAFAEVQIAPEGSTTPPP